MYWVFLALFPSSKFTQTPASKTQHVSRVWWRSERQLWSVFPGIDGWMNEWMNEWRPHSGSIFLSDTFPDTHITGKAVLGAFLPRGRRKGWFNYIGNIHLEVLKVKVLSILHLSDEHKCNDEHEATAAWVWRRILLWLFWLKLPLWFNK